MRRIVSTYHGRAFRLFCRLLVVGITGYTIATSRGQPFTASLPVYDPPNGFWIVPSDHSGKLYGPTSPDATWAVGQWDIPKDLPPFHHRTTENQFARATYHADGGYTLEQDGRGLPCTKVFSSGRQLVDEFDLLVAPLTKQNPGYPQAARNVAVPLSEIGAARESLAARLIHGNVATPHTADVLCPVTQATIFTAVLLTNPTRRQTIFYQLRLAVGRYQAGRLVWKLPAPNWFFTGNNAQNGGVGQFGYADNITEYGFTPLAVGDGAMFNLDLLPHLVALIHRGASHALDQDLSHWRLSGTYHGEAIWGPVRLKTRWGQFALTLE